MTRRKRTNINAVAIRSDGLVTSFVAPHWTSFAEQIVDVADSKWARNEHGAGKKQMRVAKVFAAADGEELREFYLVVIRAWLDQPAEDRDEVKFVEEATR
jgi:hypothetical protein